MCLVLYRHVFISWFWLRRCSLTLVALPSLARPKKLKHHGSAPPNQCLKSSAWVQVSFPFCLLCRNLPTPAGTTHLYIRSLDGAFACGLPRDLSTLNCNGAWRLPAESAIRRFGKPHHLSCLVTDWCTVTFLTWSPSQTMPAQIRDRWTTSRSEPSRRRLPAACLYPIPFSWN
jgi:hypothetical protein